MGDIVFKISPDGQKTEIEADNFVGTGCLDFAQDTIRALGTPELERKKNAYYANQGERMHVGH